MPWSLTHQPIPGGTPVTKTLEAWGVSNPLLTFEHPFGDRASWDMPRQTDFSAAPVFDLGTNGLGHRIWFTSPDGVVRFVGIITEAPCTGAGAMQATRYTAIGVVGHLLRRTAYHQLRQAGIAPATELNGVLDSQVLLGFSAAGDYQHTGAQLGDILTYAAARAAEAGHDFQHSETGFPEVEILLEQAEGITCEDACRRMLAHSPDYIGRVDYSTLDAGLPKPTFRCQSRAAMTAVNMAWQRFSPIQLTPAYEKLFRAVVINYQRTVQENGQSRIQIERDIYPATLDGNPTTGREVGALAVTVPLQGSSTQTLSSAVATEVIDATNADAGARVSWWLLNCPALRKEANLVEADSTYTGPGGEGGTGAAATYDVTGEYEVAVLANTKYFWERGANDTARDAQTTSGHFTTGSGVTLVTLHGTPDAEVTAFLGRVEVVEDDVRSTGVEGFARRLLPGSSGIAPWMERGSEEVKLTTRAKVTDKTGEHYVDLAVNLTATDAESGTYATTLLLGEGEPVPEGLAENYQRAGSTLHYQGNATLSEQAMTFAVGLGNVLNLTGAQVALTTARLMVWRCTLDLFKNSTAVEFGDPENLGLGDFIDRLRALRQRRLTIVPSSQTTGLPNGSTPANLPSVTPRAEATAKTHERSGLELSSPDTDLPQRVRANVSDLSTAPADTVVKFRQFTVCVDGTNKQAWFLASEPV